MVEYGEIFSISTDSPRGVLKLRLTYNHPSHEPENMNLSLILSAASSEEAVVHASVDFTEKNVSLNFSVTTPLVFCLTLCAGPHMLQLLAQCLADAHNVAGFLKCLAPKGVEFVSTIAPCISACFGGQGAGTQLSPAQ